MLFQRVRGVLARMLAQFRPGEGPFEDPFAGVREPRRGGPSGRDSAIAVPEPREEKPISAVGRRPDRRS